LKISDEKIPEKLFFLLYTITKRSLNLFIMCFAAHSKIVNKKLVTVNSTLVKS